MHNVLPQLRAILDEYPGDRMLVGEDDNIECMGNSNHELHMFFNFSLMCVGGPLTDTCPHPQKSAPAAGTTCKTAVWRLALQHARRS